MNGCRDDILHIRILKECLDEARLRRVGRYDADRFTVVKVTGQILAEVKNHLLYEQCMEEVVAGVRPHFRCSPRVKGGCVHIKKLAMADRHLPRFRLIHDGIGYEWVVVIDSLLVTSQMSHLHSKLDPKSRQIMGSRGHLLRDTNLAKRILLQANPQPAARQIGR